MTTTLRRKLCFLFVFGLCLVASSAFYRNWVFGHASVQTCTGPTGCATVPSTFTQTIPLGAGATFTTALPSGIHDFRIVVAVAPDPNEQEDDKDHGVGAIDLILSSVLVPDVRASWTGIDGQGKVVNANNVSVSPGQILFEANGSGSISLRYAGVISNAPNISIVNTGSIGRPVALRWIH
jgi:hypothetical protein